MSTTTPDRENGHDGGRSIEQLDDRDVRALTEPMTALPDEGRADGADGLFLVVSHTGNQYLTDTHTGSCTCPDHEYNLPTDDGREICKHVRRCEYASGQTAIPSWVDRDAVDDQLGCATDEGPRFAVADGGIIEPDDDGEILTDDDTDETDDGRPDDCNCGAWNADSGLPCWPCYRDGFRSPPADADE